MANELQARLGKHPIHPMLVVFPLGLWIFGLIAYIIFLAGGPAAWDVTAWHAIAGGCIGALLAAVAGLIDLLGMPPSRARMVGVWHMCLNVTALALFVIAFFVRFSGQTQAPLVLAIIGTAVVLVSGWLGGSLVYVHGAAISDEAVLAHNARKAAQRRGEEPGMGTAHPMPG
jgi:uncharacterized membrane protein